MIKQRNLALRQSRWRFICHSHLKWQALFALLSFARRGHLAKVLAKKSRMDEHFHRIYVACCGNEGVVHSRQDDSYRLVILKRSVIDG